MTPADDDPFERLGRLPAPDAEPAIADRIRARAHAALVGRPQPPPAWQARLQLIYARALPAGAAGLGAAYLAWALLTVASLFR